MKMIGREYVIALRGSDKDGVLASNAVIVRVEDEGAGPYLTITGRDMDEHRNEDQSKMHSFYLCEEEDIDNLCECLKTILKQAECK